MECNGADIMARKEDFTDKSNDKSLQKEGESSTVINHGSPRDKIASREVRCPYCFECFDLKRILFRADDPVIVDSDDEIEKLKLQGKFDMDFAARTDEKMLKSWKEDGWDRSTTKLLEFDYGYFELPEEEEKARKYLNSGGNAIGNVKCHIIQPEQFKDIECDDNGYPVSAEDIRGKKSTVKVCPECHRVLPGNYGKYPVYFISCIGVTGSGKTVYLSKLINGMVNNEFIDIAGFNVIHSSNSQRFVNAKSVVEGEILPGKTAQNTVKPPIDVTVQINRKSYTFVFFDIAGENCTDTYFMTNMGKFLQHSDAIIMLIAPGQIADVKYVAIDSKKDTQEIRRQEDVLKVLNTLETVFLEQNCNKKMNVAIALSKCDMYRYKSEDGQQEENIFKARDDKLKGFDSNHHSNMFEKIQPILEGTALQRKIEGTGENKAAYFAISSLGDSPIKCKSEVKKGKQENQGEKEPEKIYKAPKKIKSINVGDPIIWIMHMLGLLDETGGNDGADNRKESGNSGKSNGGKGLWGAFLDGFKG